MSDSLRTLRRTQQPPRMLTGGPIVLGGAEHPHQLSDHFLAAELEDRGAGGAAGSALRDPEMPLSKRRDLGQVRDAEDLAPGGEDA